MEGRFVRVHLEKMVYGGYALAREKGRIVLVKDAYPGEEVEAKIIKGKKDLLFAKSVRILNASPFRIPPRCAYHNVCGGCDWMGLSYERQLLYKQKIFIEQMERIAKYEIRDVEILPTKEFGYRNKIEYTLSKGKIGFHKKKSHEVIEVEKCEISSELLNILKRRVESFLRSDGTLQSTRRITLRTDGRRSLVILHTKSKLTEVPSFPCVTADKGNVKRSFTSDELSFKIHDVSYIVPPLSFFQINSRGAELLASLVKRWAGSGKNALDLYSGVGLFSLQICDNFESVLGVESSKESVAAARKNAKLNEKRNVSFKELLAEEFEFSRSYDLVIMDPPRQGLHRRVLNGIISSKIPRVIYVSCDSSTFARDSKFLLNYGYSIEKMKLVDMFPQTHHFECVGLFTIGHQSTPLR